MKTVIGIIMIIAGISLGLYVGVWFMFIGGIIQIVDTVKTDINAVQIGFGVLRIMFAGGVGALSGYVLIIPGYATINS